MKDWLLKFEPKWVALNVVGWGFLAVVLWRYDGHATKMEDTHLRLVDKVVDTQERISDVQAKELPILERIDRNTSK
jgi:hypothetical protein